MNDTFDIKRLGKLIKYEIVNYIPRYFKSLIILASAIVALWLYSYVWFPPFERKALIAVLLKIAIFLAPYIVYKNMNGRKNGYIYAMIPASSLEKLISMTFVCVVCVPVLAYVVFNATHILVYLLSSIWHGTLTQITFYNPFIDETVMIIHNDVMYNKCVVLDNILINFACVVYPMMFNTIFRKNKVLKTILFNMTLLFVFVILASSVINASTSEFWKSLFEGIANRLDNMTAQQIISCFLMIFRCLTILFIALCLAITYFRIKKVNY